MTNQIGLVNSSFRKDKPNLPIGPLIIRGVLKEQGYDVFWKDYQLDKSLDHGSHSSFFRFLSDIDADIIGIYCLANTLPMILNAVHLLKERKKFVKVILGGPGVSYIGEELLKISKVDAIVDGEGEEAVPELIEYWKNQSHDSKVPRGVYLRGKENHLIYGGYRPLLKNINYQPLVKTDELEWYKDNYSLITSRGCKFSCSFCAKPIWGNHVIFRDLDDVFDEIDRIKGKVKRINICDDTFMIDEDRVKEFCHRYKSEKINIPWECTGRIGLLTHSNLQMLADANCKGIFIGVESGSDVVLKHISKGIRSKDIVKDVQLAKSYIDRVYTSYMWGFPFETFDMFISTIEMYINDLLTEGIYPTMTLATPFHNTKLYLQYSNLIYLENNHYNGCSIPKSAKFEDSSSEKQFVLQNQQLFPQFYAFKHEELDKKVQYIDHLRRRGDIDEEHNVN